MPEQKIHVLGSDEIVLLLGLLGIEGTIIEQDEEFLKKFDNLTNDSSISMIIIAIDLSENIIDFLIDFKINRRKPFIFYMPDIFTIDEGKNDMLLKKVYESIEKILT